MNKFRVGQKVGFRRVSDSKSPTGGWLPSKLVGKVGVVQGPPIKDYVYGWALTRYPVEVEGTRYDPVELSMIPLYDGDEPASWETCAWRPKEIVLAPSS